MKVNKVYSDVVNLTIYRKTTKNEPTLFDTLQYYYP